MNPEDTIAAVSSAVGAAARMIVRLSGPEALRVAAELAQRDSNDLLGGAWVGARLHFAGLSVPATLYVFRCPHSYTRDDLVEFHIPGNPLLARMLLDHLVRAGARPADPGEFTARAFFNGRLDLTEAEGVAATIAAGNQQELSAARQLLAGELARRLRPAMDLLAETLALLEAGIDFADDEGVSFLSPEQLARRVADADTKLRRLLDDSSRFERLAHEPTAVLVGRPNAGKSTLLNALAGHERAVTSPVAGTTRDVLSAQVVLPRGILRVIDLAGVDEGDAVGEIGRQMRDRALRAVETADVVLLVHDLTDRRPPLALSREPDLTILTKLDLLGSPAGDRDTIAVSAITGANLDQLRGRLDRIVFGASDAAGGATLALNTRHVNCIREARDALSRVAGGQSNPPEVTALELREALDALGQVLGAVTPDDLLGRIFSAFCIGK
jgi:tRNA modification GTPase